MADVTSFFENQGYWNEKTQRFDYPNDDYFRVGKGYERPRFETTQSNMYQTNPWEQKYFHELSKYGARKLVTDSEGNPIPKPIAYMNGAKAPYEQGPSDDDKKTFKNAKQTLSQTFDINGSTETQENTDEAGVKTKTTVTKPAEVLMNEQQNYEMIQQPSIAAAPNNNVTRDTSQSIGLYTVPLTQEDIDEEVNIATASTLAQESVFPMRDDGDFDYTGVKLNYRNQMAAEESAEFDANHVYDMGVMDDGDFGGASIAEEKAEVTGYENIGTVVSRVPFERQTNTKAHDYREPIKVMRDGEEFTYQDYTVTLASGLVIQEATVRVGDEDDLAYWDPETKALRPGEVDEDGNNWASRVISRVENGDGTVTYKFNNSLGAWQQRPVDTKEETELSIAESGVAAIEAQIAAASTEGVFISKEELVQLEKDLAYAETRLAQAVIDVKEKEINQATQAKQITDLHSEAILDSEARLLEEELKSKAASGDLDPNNQDSNYKYNVQKAVEVIKEENPAAIEELNNFADWADEVSDEESQAAARDYLDDLAEQPTVNQRFKKAMAIAFAAMLFGDDFSTAMNTGFGVVADDYDEEKLEAQTIAEAEAALALKIAEEERAFIRGNLNSARDFQEQLYIEGVKQTAAQVKAAKEADDKRKKFNVEQGDKVLKDLFEMNKDHENFYNLSNKSVQTQMAGLREKIEDFAPKGFVLDFRDATQMHAIGTVLKKFVSEQLHFKDGTAPDLATYAEEIFTKIELEQYTNIDPNLIAPSRGYLQGLGVDMDELDKSQWHGLQQGTKETLRLGETIQQIAAIGDGKTSIGEQMATHLLYKDFLMFKANRPDSYKEMIKIANSKGVGHFTQFVNVTLPGLFDSMKQPHEPGYGMNFDPAYQAINRKDYTSDADFRKAQDSYILKYIKDNPLDFQ